jgi:hypothetical protein
MTILTISERYTHAIYLLSERSMSTRKDELYKVDAEVIDWVSYRYSKGCNRLSYTTRLTYF